MKAFPTQTFDMDKGGVNYDIDGMDLRDYFAAKAMQALIEDGHDDSQWLALRSYEYANAMMEVRKNDKQ